MNSTQNRKTCRSFRAVPLAIRSHQRFGVAVSRPPWGRAQALIPPALINESYLASYLQLRAVADPQSQDCSIAFYRRRTEMLLRRYLRMALEVGRVPSCLPREALRAKCTVRQRAGSFEDCVIFVHDVERCLERLGRMHSEVLTRVALQEYTQREASEILGVPQKSLGRYYDDALDTLSALLLDRSLMERDK